jgi:hypothetical protein
MKQVDVNDPQVEQRVASPCVYICALDDNNICMGCYRSGEEITHWGRYSNDEKREVLKKVGERERASMNFYTPSS